MIVEVGETVRRGRAIDLTDLSVMVKDVERALQGEDGRVSLDRDGSEPIHEYVGVIRGEIGLPLRSALATVARSRGMRAPQSTELERVRQRIDEIEIETVDLGAARKRVASTGEEGRALRERVEMHRGQVELLERRGEDSGERKAELRAAITRLSEVETERIAAEQALDRARERARTARDERERRLRLEDRAAALEREARTALADAVYDEFATAVEVVPGGGEPGEGPGTYRGDAVTAALAIARIASIDPVVLACRRFHSAEAAAACLDAPVLRL